MATTRIRSDGHGRGRQQGSSRLECYALGTIFFGSLFYNSQLIADRLRLQKGTTTTGARTPGGFLFILFYFKHNASNDHNNPRRIPPPKMALPACLSPLKWLSEKTQDNDNVHCLSLPPT